MTEKPPSHEDFDRVGFDQKAGELEKALNKLKKEDDNTISDKVAGERVFAEIVGGLLFGVIAGYLIDDYFDTQPIFLLILIILGLAGSIYNIYKASVKNNNN